MEAGRTRTSHQKCCWQSECALLLASHHTGSTAVAEQDKGAPFVDHNHDLKPQPCSDCSVLLLAWCVQVYQRQMMKSDLADATMQGGGSVNRMSHDELKQLFNLDLGPECSTRKLLEASNAGSNVVWLQLQAADGSGAGLPAALAGAVAAGAVTAVNRERQQQQGEETGDPDGEQVEPAVAASGSIRGDVDALEVEDDW